VWRVVSSVGVKVVSSVGRTKVRDEGWFGERGFDGHPDGSEEMVGVADKMNKRV